MTKKQYGYPTKISDTGNHIIQHEEYKITKNNDENIFTDPKLFSLIKNDLQEIKMRKSMADVSKYQSHQSSRSNSVAVDNTRPSLLDKRVPEQTSSHYQLTTIEMIKESSQESQDDDFLSNKKTFEASVKKVENILSDSEVGFKKKQADSKRENQKEISERNHNKK